MAAIPALFGLLMAALVSGQSVEISPAQEVRRVGDELTVTCKVPYAIDSCRMTVGRTPYRLLPSIQEGDVVYSGRGLDVGECGAHIRHVREEWSGEISCTLPPPSGSIELTATMRLIVAKAPSAPQLEVWPAQTLHRAGDRLQVQCVVPAGRPAPNLTWFLDEEPLVQGVHEPRHVTEGDLVTVLQNVTRELRPEDNGRRLACRAGHVALDLPAEAARQLFVQYPLQRVDGETGPLTIFGLKLGVEGRLNVTLRGSPGPDVEWTVAGQRLGPGQETADGAAAAIPPLVLGGGYYNVTLVLARVSKEDVERTYFLRADNGLGTQEIAVRISTMDEPAGVELDAGAVVGVVAGVVALVVAAALVVFARATSRWCFAGRSHRPAAPDGADSEAPLPPHEDVKGSENPTHDHADYITDGDTKHPENPTHDHADYITNGNTKHPEKKPDTAV